MPSGKTMLELGEGWTPAIRNRCQDSCTEFGDPPCYELAGTGLVGGPVEYITPCDQCNMEQNHDR